MKMFSKQSMTVLGLTLDGGTLNAVELKRSNGAAHIVRQVSAPLALDPLRDEPELVGREIRNLLNGARITTKRCVAGVPASWALTLHTQIPAIEGEDVTSLLALEAERGFACGVDELRVSSRIYRTENGEGYATMIGVPTGYLERLESVLAAAQLKTASISIGILALPEAQSGAVTAEIADAKINLLLGSKMGVVALRTIEGAFDSEGAEKRIQGDLLARELRITLGQLSPEVRQSIQQFNIFGERRFADQLLEDMAGRIRNWGLQARHVTTCQGTHHGVAIEGNAPVSSALSLAAAFLSDETDTFEFLPPKPTVWEQISSRYSSRGLAYAGGAAVAILLLTGGAFLFQQLELSKQENKWAGMKTKVSELEELQNKARQFRPWNDSSFGTMNIMRRITEAFPEDGAVSAKMIEIRNGNVISCRGTAKDNQSLLKTIDRLRGTPQVRDLRVDQISGKAPLQFTFNFQWGAVTDED